MIRQPSIRCLRSLVQRNTTSSKAQQLLLLRPAPNIARLNLLDQQYGDHQQHSNARSMQRFSSSAIPAAMNGESSEEGTLTSSSSSERQQQHRAVSRSKNATSKRSVPIKKDPLVVTERAAERIQDLLLGESATGAIGIRLGVRRRGCNGLSYTLNYAMPEDLGNESIPNHKRNIEMIVKHNGVRVLIEPMALFNVVGTTMDWEETELASEFTFQNPNSKGECGCGESFNV